jgi:hypothetical protein
MTNPNLKSYCFVIKMSDNKTESKSNCKNGVCVLSPPQIEETTEKPGPAQCKVECPEACSGNGPPTDAGSCEAKSCPVTADGQAPSIQDVFASSFQNIHSLISQAMDDQQGTEKKRKSRKKRARRSHDSDDDSEDSSSSEDESDSEADSDDSDSDDDISYQRIPDYKWAAFHQLLDSHSALCSAFVRLLNRDEDDDDDEE